MINDYSEGGLKATWIQKYLDPESRSKWKRLFDSELERNGGEAILKGNLNKKDVNNLKISDPFVKEILVICKGDKKKKKKSGSGSSTSSNSRPSTPTIATDGAANTIAAAATKLSQDRPGTPCKYIPTIFRVRK